MIITQKNPIYITSEQRQPNQHTTRPVVTGSSVIALTFNGGVIMASDTLCSYGSMADFKNQNRIEKISQSTMVSATGEFSDFQEVVRILTEKSKEAFLHDDGVVMTPRDYANYLSRISYNLRNKLNPLYVMNVIAKKKGMQGGQRYLGSVDLYGTYLEAKYVATGFSGYFCKPIIENYWKDTCTETEARNILLECFKVLFYRDARAIDTIQIAVVDHNGVRIEPAVTLETKWNHEGFVNKANEKLHTQ